MYLFHEVLHPDGVVIKRCLALLFFRSQDNTQKPLMCNMEKNHVHHSIKFSLGFNGTLPLFTLVSTHPDKPICCGSCQPTKRSPSAHWKKTQRPCSFLLRTMLPTSSPSYSSWPVPHKVMTHPPTFLYILSQLPQRSKLRGVGVNAELNTERPPDNLGGPVPIYTASRWCLSIVWQEGVRSNCVKPHIVKVDKESLLSSWYKVQVTHTKDCLCVKTNLALWMNMCTLNTRAS